MDGYNCSCKAGYNGVNCSQSKSGDDTLYPRLIMLTDCVIIFQISTIVLVLPVKMAEHAKTLWTVTSAIASMVSMEQIANMVRNLKQ